MHFQGKFLRENEEVKSYSPNAATARHLADLLHNIISSSQHLESFSLITYVFKFTLTLGDDSRQKTRAGVWTRHFRREDGVSCDCCHSG